MNLAICLAAATTLTYPIVDTGQVRCFGLRTEIDFPKSGQPFYGQDAQYRGNAPSYRDNKDGTVSDLVTGLMWTQDSGAKATYDEAMDGAARCRTGGHDDWRLPTIKQLYSLIQFNGTDPDPRGINTSALKPFIDAAVFKFQYGRPEDGDRIIDSQYATSTRYTSTTMDGNATMFGVNFADGRIKGYPIEDRRRGMKKFRVLYVRGNPDYGTNRFKDKGDGTVADEATGLMWMKTDSGKGMDWQAALQYAENLVLAGHDDWRLPNAKELQSIVDYGRSPDATGSAAIDPVFACTQIRNEGGKPDYPFYWTGTSHVSERGADTAVYIAFGRALGWMSDGPTEAFRMRDVKDDKTEYRLMDVHGAGAQRSDPKVGDSARFPHGRGPQGDVIRIANFVRCVRGGLAADLR